jgi:hypothetical protein
MNSKQRPPGVIVVLALGLALLLGSGFSQPARAASEDVAMFYDDLSQYGQWVDYENYGPVWHPNNAGEEWRPYTNGRWVPTNDGQVFETQEPWGWATYHYGNWMPTPGYGWVWVPGRTWYPSTVEWRTSPETAPVDDSYIGWAPTPPPNYVPAQNYAPPAYYPGAPASSLLSDPFWVFVRAASFLLGLGQPFAPAYSYMAQPMPVFVAPAYVPVLVSRTFFAPTYMTPTYYPAGFISRGYVGAYSWGPSISYMSRVSNLNPTMIHQTINQNTVNFTRINNVMAPGSVISRNAALRNIQPPALTQGRPLPPSQPVTNIRLAQANLNKPNIIPAPKNVPPLPAQIPKAPPLAAQPLKGAGPGAGLPARATMPLTPQQQAHIQQLPATKQLRPGQPPLAGQPAVQPGKISPKPGVGSATPAYPAIPPKAGVPSQPKGTAPPGTFQAGGAKPTFQPRPGYKPPPTAYVKPGTQGVAQPGVGQFKPATPTQQVRPQPQVKPIRPHPQPVTSSPQPRPQPQPARLAPVPQPRPAPAGKPPPKPQPQQQKEKKPGET